MNGYQNIKRQLLPLIKGLPIIILTFLGALGFAKAYIFYSPAVYQSMAKLKLDDQKFGFSNNNLYGDFDVFSTENKIETEAELLKSPLLINKALDSLNFDVSYYRIGSIKKTMLYGSDLPFNVIHSMQDDKLFNKKLQISIDNESKVSIVINEIMHKGLTDKPIVLGKNSITINQKQVDESKPMAGNYEIIIHSREHLISQIIENLDVTATDKEIAILRVVYKDEHPKKVADLTNELCAAYIDDYIFTKSIAASKTVQFIDEKLNEISIELKNSESLLEQFKIKNNVVNTLQETETGLREISKLNIQNINMGIEKESLDQLESYIKSGSYFDQTAVNFGFGDLTLTEMTKKLKALQDEKLDLTTKYTDNDEKVINIKIKINDIKEFIIEAIAQNKKDLELKQIQIDSALDLASHQFDNLPTTEKEMHILKRDFTLNESVYNFLSQKKIEATIASSAMLSFHRVIQPALASDKPVSPNHTLIKFVSGLLGLIIGISIIYLRTLTRARVTSREEIEKKSTLPIAGVIRNNNTSQDFDIIAKSIIIKNNLTIHNSIVVTSSLAGEGKSFCAFYLAKSLQKMGYTICIIDANSENPTSIYNSTVLPENLNQISLKNDLLAIFSISHINFKLIQNKIKTLTDLFDFVIIDTSATAINVDAINHIRSSSLTLYINRLNYTGINYLDYPDRLKETYNIENTEILINDAMGSMNYTGNFIGKRFRYANKNIGFKQSIKYYMKNYFSL